MRLFQEQNLPSKAVQGEDSAAEFVFLSQNFGYERVYLEFNEAMPLFKYEDAAPEGSYFVFH